MKNAISLVLVLALGLAIEVANADFVFGKRTHLGPAINSPTEDAQPSISADGLSLFFHSERSGGYGGRDIWVAKRATKNGNWTTLENVGPPVNTSHRDSSPDISPDGLTLYFDSDRPGGSGESDIWVTTRTTKSDPWGTPVNLGPTVNASSYDAYPSVLADGLMLFMQSYRPGGCGGYDIWMTTRQSKEAPWTTPVNLGSTVNSSVIDGDPCISPDGLVLFFTSLRPGGYGIADLYLVRRATIHDSWDPPVNLGPIVNSSPDQGNPSISADGLTLYFASGRPGGEGDWDLWQVSIEPVVDFNGDGVVDCADMCEMVDHWGTDEQLYDIGPMPWGDGIVDVKDLIILAEHLFEGIPPVEPEEVNVDEKDDGSQVELEQGQILVVTLESNPTTGYSWEVVETQESVLEQMGEAEFEQSDTGEPPLVGAGGWEIFHFKAIGAGQMTLQLAYRRPWEEGVAPIQTFSIQIVVK